VRGKRCSFAEKYCRNSSRLRANRAKKKNMDLRLHNRHSVAGGLPPATDNRTVPVSCIALHTGWCQSKLKQRRQAIGSTASARAGGSCRHSHSFAGNHHALHHTNKFYLQVTSKTTCATAAFFVSTRCCIDLQYVRAQPPSLQSQTQELQLNCRFTV